MAPADPERRAAPLVITPVGVPVEEDPVADPAVGLAVVLRPVTVELPDATTELVVADTAALDELLLPDPLPIPAPWDGERALPLDATPVPTATLETDEAKLETEAAELAKVKEFAEVTLPLPLTVADADRDELGTSLEDAVVLALEEEETAEQERS